MKCRKCGNSLRDGAEFCGRCGKPVHADTAHEPDKSARRPKTWLIILVCVIVMAVIGVGTFFLIRAFTGDDPKPAAVTEPTSHAAEFESGTVHQDPTIAATQTETVKPTEKATEALFSISAEELEKEIERIREYYYTPSAADDQIVLNNGTDGWNYSRDYRYHNGKLVFAFIFDGTEEHRLYFKDDHMIRYIDENGVTYDHPVSDAYSSWAEKALKEAYAKYTHDAVADDPDSEWFGTWKCENGESIEVTSVTKNGIVVIHTLLNEIGDRWMHTEMKMKYTDNSHLKVVEDLNSDIWKYFFTLCDGYILVESRYPDMKFYKAS